MGLGLLVIGVIGLALVSGGSSKDPQTPEALPGTPPPFFGVAVVGSGGRTMAVDAYGNVVDLRAPGPAGEPLVEVPTERQATGTVPADAGIVARARLDGKRVPLWEADSVEQRYLPGTNVLWTVARFGKQRAVVTRGLSLRAVRADRRWVAQAQQLGPNAPAWARRMYERSLLVLRALTDRRTGAVAAGARDGWAYIWPRDAGAVALALAASGYRAEARQVVRFLRRLDLEAAARFHGDGAPVEGRAAQGDAAGWLVAAERDAEVSDAPANRHGPAQGPSRTSPTGPWRDRADYQEGAPGDYVANAIASGVRNAALRRYFEHLKGLVRVTGDPDSGVDSAIAWAVRPFPRPALFPLVRRSLRHLLAERRTRFGIVPSASWHGGEDPWTAPTAWTAWAFAALDDRRTALSLMADLRRAATPLGLLPERVDVQTGLPASTTPLAWSHAFTILALRELWP